MAGEGDLSSKLREAVLGTQLSVLSDGAACSDAHEARLSPAT